jgi:hypothetical protein
MNHDLQMLFDRVKSGDLVAERQLDRALEPVVSRAVRRIMQTEDYGTPLGQRVRGLLAEDAASGFSSPSEDLRTAALTVARKICRQTVARLKSFGWEGRHAAETVWA